MFDPDAVSGLDGDLLEDVIKEFQTGWEMERTRAAIHAQQASVFEEASTVEGLGQLRLSIDPTSFHYWGNRLGYDCWDDKQFLREYERDNPAARVRHVQRNATIVSTGPTWSNKRETVRF